MKAIHILMIGIVCIAFTGCGVIYDPYTDGVRYKPESNFDYIKLLGPTQIHSLDVAEKEVVKK